MFLPQSTRSRAAKNAKDVVSDLKLPTTINGNQQKDDLWEHEFGVSCSVIFPSAKSIH